MTPLLLGMLLLALLLGLAAAFVWQEARQLAIPELTYVLEDAVRFVVEQRMDESNLSPEDIRRILEWEVVYLQGISPHGTRRLEPVRVGNSDDATKFIFEQLGQPVAYSEGEIRQVLAGEAAYLVSIGAVGAAVVEEEAVE